MNFKLENYYVVTKGLGLSVVFTGGRNSFGTKDGNEYARLREL